MTESEAAVAARPSSSSRPAVLTVAGVFFLLLLDSSILNTSLPQVARSMGVAPLALSPTITGYLLASVVAMPLSGWFSGKFGARRVYLASIFLFMLSSAACGASGSLWQLIAARVVQGAAGGLMFTVGRSLALRDAPRSELLSITSMLVWPALLAPVLGPPLGGLITTYISWRWNFLLNVPLGCVALALIARFVPPDEDATPPPMDWPGAVLTAAGLACLFGGLETTVLAASEPGRWPLAAGLVLLGAVLLGLAFRHLKRAAHPVLGLSPLKARTFRLATSSAGIYSAACLQATPYLLPLGLQIGFGLSAAAAGALMLPYFVGNLVMKSVTTPLLRRFGFRHILLVDGALAMVLIGMFSLLTPQTPYVLTITVLVLAGASRSMLFTAINTLAFVDVGQAERGHAATLSSISQLLSQSLGITLSALLLAATQVIGQRPALAAADFRIAFVGVALIGLLSLLPYLRVSAQDGQEVIGKGPGA
ncbi:MAG: transporter [Polaromonas sp.]|nr:transporter [Polaromonas sp.]